MIKPPSYSLEAALAPSPGIRTDPSWFADWGLDPPDGGCMLWEYQTTSGIRLLEFGSFPEMHADWSTVSRGAFDHSVFLALAKDGPGLTLRFLDDDRAIAWAKQQNTETRPDKLYTLECHMKPVDLDTAERIDLDFWVRGKEPDDLSFRQRGGFSLPNPWRRPGK
jgi:hypothetical protein